MLVVTERARQELKRILSAKVDNPQASLRLIASGPSGNFGLSIDAELPGDQVVEYKGSKVLLVEHGLATRFEGRTLDVEDTTEGRKLAIFKEIH